MKKLGFGAMRLPKLSETASDIDHSQVCRMVDTFIENGFTYFDTAYMYHDGTSEMAVRDDLVRRYDRERFLLADKLPTMRLNEVADMQRIFDEQRTKCGVEYFDYYLLHNLNTRFYETAVKLDAFDFIRRKKEEGSVKNIGFSFHAGADLLEEILSKNPDVDFVQLQINYLDWEHAGIQSRKCYEVARKYGKPVIVMEPVKGGTLAKLPERAEALMRAYAPDASPASWAIRYAASLEGVMTVLSGMSDYSQLCDNIGYMKDFKPLSAEEQDIIRRVQTIMYESTAIPCTGCAYCTEGCPANIPIPEFFSLYNAELQAENKGFSTQEVYYSNHVKAGVKASDCIACGQCETQCPQNLPVIELLKSVARTFEE
ncbi:MAG: aldo/keto reductase [Clostridia bacterium]|nr:aldo/keto reductase [Clostridia bacterium]